LKKTELTDVLVGSRRPLGIAMSNDRVQAEVYEVGGEAWQRMCCICTVKSIQCRDGFQVGRPIAARSEATLAV